MIKKLTLFTALILSFPILVSAQREGLNSIKKDNLISYMTFFASDEMKGRETGTPENDAAALYIRSNLIRLGVKGIPGSGSYYQEVPMHMTGTENRITAVYGDKVYSTDSVILLMPPMKDMETKSAVVFTGFGYYNEKAGYDDIKEVDLKDKIAIVMTGTPESVKSKKGRTEVFTNDEQQKLVRFLMKGAKAVYFVYNPSSDHHDPYASGIISLVGSASINIEGKQTPGLPIQIGFISQHAANILLKPSGYDLAALQDKIIFSGKPHSFEIQGLTVTATSKLKKENFKSRNIIGVIEGSDPALKNEYILYSAHMDHTGVSEGKINNGADDNASGSMTLLEVANAFMNLKKKPARTIVFVWVNGEEKGLLGSGYYVDNPVFPLDKTLLDINLDMVGRTKMPSDTGTVFGTDLSVTGPRELEYYTLHESSGLDVFVTESARQAGIRLLDKGNDLEWGGSDHMSFRSKGVVALMFHSGIHADLHSERDDVEKIDFDKMERTAKMCFLLGYKVANQKERFTVDTRK